jgi:vitamin B12 transporter
VFAADGSTDLNPIVVTATRTAQTADATLASVTVITRKDIEQLQPQSLQDLFVGLPGVSISNNGGPGKPTQVYLRGTEADHTLVLIDGIKIGSVSAGTAAFEQIPIDQIERIEIVRGPRSSLYGSEAIGGVIQIFTRKGSADGKLTPSFSVGGGTYNTWQGQGGLSGGNGHAWYSASISGYQTKGINATQPGYFDYEPDADGYWNTAGSVRGGYYFDNGAEVSADWLHIYGDNLYDGSYQNKSKVAQQVLGGTVKLPRIGVWQSSVTAGQSEDKSADFENNSYVGRFDSQRTSVAWQNDVQLVTGQTLTVGSDYLHDHLFSDASTPYPVTSREDLAAFGQYQALFGPHDVQLSVRGDHAQQFGGYTTGGAAYGYTFSRALRVMASYGTAFKAPTFNELYFPDYGNPSLRPERSRSGEIGIAGRPGFVNWSLDAYQINASDLITSVLVDPVNFTYEAHNVAHARIRGLEGQLGANWRHWRTQLSATLLDPRDRSPDGQNNVLPRRAQQTARLDVDRDFARFSFGTTLFVSGRTFDDLTNQVSLGGYGTMDVRAGYRIENDWLLSARLSNLFDHHYENAQYYNQPGRAVFFTLRYQPSRT